MFPAIGPGAESGLTVRVSDSSMSACRLAIAIAVAPVLCSLPPYAGIREKLQRPRAKERGYRLSVVSFQQIRADQLKAESCELKALSQPLALGPVVQWRALGTWPLALS